MCSHIATYPDLQTDDNTYKTEGNQAASNKLNKQAKMKREIETYQLTPYYFEDSWTNGNKSHVKQELSDLFVTSPMVCIKTLLDLPTEISQAVVESEQFKDANHIVGLERIRGYKLPVS